MTDVRQVLFFDAYPHLLGGAQRTVLALAAEISRRGSTPRILVPADGVFPERARALGLRVDVVVLPSVLGHFGRTTTGARRVGAAAALPVAWRRLAAAIRSAEPEVCHVNDHRGLLLAGPAARLAGCPFVWHVHSTDVAGGLVERTVGRLAGGVVGPSVASLEGPARTLPRARRTVVRPPLDESIRGLGPAHPAGHGRIVLAARLHPAKGVDVALRAVAALVGDGRDVHLDVYGAEQPGREDYGAELRRLASELDLSDRVTWHGHVEEPHHEWLEADVYVQPSRSETFGMGVAEAMSLGLPVVATRVGGLPELIADGETGLLVPPEDPLALSAAIARLLDHPARAAALAAAGRDGASGHSTERAVDDLSTVWNDVVRS